MIALYIAPFVFVLIGIAVELRGIRRALERLAAAAQKASAP